MLGNHHHRHDKKDVEHNMNEWPGGDDHLRHRHHPHHRRHRHRRHRHRRHRHRRHDKKEVEHNSGVA